MDAEHRHELKTNELADWMGHFPDICRKNAKTIIGVGLIIAAVVVFFYSRGVRAKSQFEQETQAMGLIERLDYNKFMTVQAQQANTAQGTAAAGSIRLSAESLEMAASEAKSPYVAALLLIKQGDALRIDLHYKTEEVDADIVGNQIAKARTVYEKALIQAQGNNTLVGMANFGLGMCAEEIGDYTQAAKIYNSIIADANFAGTVLPQQAQDRLDNIEDNKMQFIFVAAGPKAEDIMMEFPAPKPFLPDAPKPDSKQPGSVEIKPTGEDTASPVAPVTEEAGPALPDTSKTEMN